MTPRYTGCMDTNTHAAEIAHDTRLLELFGVAARANTEVEHQTSYLISAASAYVESGFKYRSATRRGGEGGYVVEVESTFGERTITDTRPATAKEAEAILNRVLAGETLTFNRGHGSYGNRPAEEAVKRLGSLAGALTDQREAKDAIDAHEEAYTGWNRFYLVTSSPGHVHSSMRCSSCNWNTRFAPVPSLSGSSEAEAVEVLGETLCTVCFPSAPVKPSKITQAQATKLLEDGEQAFLDARAAFLAKKASK